MIDRPVRIGTRGSALALAQTEIVADRLREEGHEVEVIEIRTSGDRAQRDGSMMLARGAFVNELERALVGEEIDLAVHSAKDLPTGGDPATELVAFPPREDPRDAVVSRDGSGLDGLPEGARVGTESPRRRAFLLLSRPDLAPTPIRGNVDTRLRKLDAGDYEALVVAVAGLRRLGLEGRISETLDPDTMIPAVGQGALALQMRADDPLAGAVRGLDDPDTRAAVIAERSFLETMGGGCRAPFAALGRAEDGRLSLEGAAVDPAGAQAIRDRVEGDVEEATSLGERLAESLLSRGAADFVAAAREESG
ncbi:MAG: hydroxymethylbilane synthase [Gemmatimonadota bacterium]|nr:hydroxymethylbilane synthase [Gemmatimonadota bacterium]